MIALDECFNTEIKAMQHLMGCFREELALFELVYFFLEGFHSVSLCLSVGSARKGIGRENLITYGRTNEHAH